jgi:hypothetical protein
MTHRGAGEPVWDRLEDRDCYILGGKEVLHFRNQSKCDTGIDKLRVWCPLYILPPFHSLLEKEKRQHHALGHLTFCTVILTQSWRRERPSQEPVKMEPGGLALLTLPPP